jgi:hypothetical protein
MCLGSKERAAARQRAAAIASDVQLVKKLPTPNKDREIPDGVYKTIREAVQDEHEMRTLCEYWAGNPVIDWHVYDSESADYTALFLACLSGRVDTARLLISAGADVNAVHDGMTALLFACIHADLPMVRLLVNEGADVNCEWMMFTSCLDLIMERIEGPQEGLGFRLTQEGLIPVSREDLLAIAEILRRAGGWRGGFCLCLCNSYCRWF